MVDLFKVMQRECLHSEHAAQCFLDAKRRDKARNKQTQDQVAAVMLMHGTQEQQEEALRHCVEQSGYPIEFFQNKEEKNVEINLQKGKALLLIGPNGCGKSKLAIEIAGKHGSFTVISFNSITKTFGLSAVMHNKPNTVIVEEPPLNKTSFEKMKALVANDTITIHHHGKKDEVVNAPNFIFCSNDLNPFSLGIEDRRFMVVNMSPEKSKRRR